MSSEQERISELEAEVKSLKAAMTQQTTHVRELENVNRELCDAVNGCTCDRE